MPRRTPPNFLDHVPTRSAESTVGEDGLTIVLAPKFGSGITARAAKKILGRRAFMKLHLDDLGSATWNLIDGTKTVGEIAEAVFSDASSPSKDSYVRTSKFLGMLSRIGAISVVPPAPENRR